MFNAKFISPITIVILFLSLENSYAVDSESIITEQEKLQKLEDQKKLREKTIKKSKKKDNNNLDIKKETSNEKNELCFNIKEIIFDGSSKLNKKQKKSLKKNHLNKCLSLQNINSIIKEVTNLYIKEGFITTRAYLPKQNLKSGKLIIAVIEGKIEKIEINKNSKEDIQRMEIAFPKNNTLLLRDLEKGIENLENTKSVKAKMDIHPGSKSGSSIVSINTKDSRPYHFNTSFDNMGQQSTGVDRLKVNANLDNLFSLNEVYSLTYQSSLDYLKKPYNSRYLNFSYSMPYQYYKYNFSYSNSYYFTTSKGDLETEVETEGKTDNFSLSLNKELFKKRKFDLYFDTKLNYSNSKSYIFDALDPPKNYSLSSLNLGFKGSIFTKGIYFAPSLFYEFGIPLFGSHDDNLRTNDQYFKAKYVKSNFGLYVYKSWEFKNKNSIALTTDSSFQYTTDNLYNAKKFSIGDSYSVRGFKEEGLSGNNGFYFNNTLTYKHNFKNKSNWVLKNIKAIDIYTGYDFGEAQNIYKDDTAKQLSGSTFGLRVLGKSFDFNLEYSKALTKPDYFKEEDVFNFKINKSF